MADIDSLSIGIQGNVESANKAVDDLIKNLDGLAQKIGSISKIPIKLDLDVKGLSNMQSVAQKAFSNISGDIGSIGDKLAKSFNIDGKNASANISKQLFGIIQQATDSFDGKKLRFEGGNELARNLVDDITQSGKIARSELRYGLTGLEEEYRDFYEYFNKHKIYVSDFIKSGIGKTEFSDLLQTNLRNITTDAQKGINIDRNWGELLDRFPSVLPQGVDNAAERVITVLQRIRDIRDEIKPIPIQNLVGDDYKNAETKIRDSVFGSVAEAGKKLGDEIKKVKDEQTSITPTIKINEEGIISQIQSALRKAAKVDYEPLSIDLKVDANKIKSDLSESLKGVNLTELSNTFSQFQNITFDASSIVGLSNAISILGRKSAEAGIKNIPILTDAVKNMLTVFFNLPAIDNSIVQMTQSLAELSKNGHTLRSAMEEVKSASATIANIPEPKIFTDSAFNSIEDFKNRIIELDNIVESGGVYSESSGSHFMPVAEIQSSMEMLREMFPEAADLIESYQALWERASELGGNFVPEGGFKYDSGAMKAVFGEAYAEVENFQQAMEKVGAKTKEEFIGLASSVTKEVPNSLKELEENLSKISAPKIDTTSLKELQRELLSAEAKIERLRARLENRISLKLIKESPDDKNFLYAKIQIAEAEQYAAALRDRMKELGIKASVIEGLDNLGKTMPKIGAAVQKVRSQLKALDSMIWKVASGFKKFASNIISLKGVMPKVTKANNDLGASFKRGFVTFLKYALGIRSIYVLFNRIRRAIVDGFKNLAQYSEETNASISLLANSMTQFKNASASMFAPLLNAFAPALNQLIQLCISATNALNQLFSALTGKSTWIRATKQTADFAAGLDKANGAAKKLYSTTLGIDELNINAGDKDNGGGAGTDDKSAEDMFETVPIESNFLELANKVKEIFSGIFSPIKESWDRDGQGVMGSFRTSLGNIQSLAKTIGQDFLTMWNQEETVKMFQDILGIVESIGTFAGNLASNFKTAWSENEVGLSILQNIRDIFAIIAGHVKTVAEKTAEWARGLDFGPLLEGFNNFTESLKPVVDAIGGILSDFYTKVLLPLGQWVLEKGLPDLLKVFTDFNNTVDWEALRSNLSTLWEHLEPFAETVGEGLIIFIDRVSDALADFLNSQEFKDFLKTIEDWMDNVSAEDVANAMEFIVKALIGLKLAILGFGVISTVTGVLTTIKTFLGFFGVGGAGAAAASGMEGVATSAVILNGALSVLFATLAASTVIDLFGDKFKELGEKMGMNKQQVETLSDRYEGVGGKLKVVGDYFSLWVNKLDGFGWNASNTANQIGALEHVMKQIGDGAIYTDEQLKKMQERFGVTDDDVEMLRQAMLDAHPELRQIADDFGLFDASAQTLQDIAGGMDVLSRTTGDTQRTIDLMTGSQSAMTDEAKNFFATLSESGKNIDSYKSSMDNAAESAKGMGDEFKKAGDNIISGINSGMNNADTDAPAENFFTKVLNSIKRVFGIHSPAENMKPLGEYILLGVVEGFEGKVSEFSTAIENWWGEHVAPWFTSEKWAGILENVKTAFSTKWEELKKWWSESTLVKWWEEDVAPWFTTEKWGGMLENIKESFGTKWGDTVEQWKKDIKKWWGDHVAPWFTKDKWVEVMGGVKEGFATSFRNALEAARELFNKFIGWLNEKMKFSWESFTIAGKTLVEAGSIQLFTIPEIPKFAEGGLVDTGQIFLAREAGPELVGTYGGHTAVANNDMIVEGIAAGVRAAVKDAVAEVLAPYLSDIANSNREIASKDTSVIIGDEDIALANRRGLIKRGFDFERGMAYS